MSNDPAEFYSNDTVVQPIFTEVRSVVIQDGQLSLCGRFQFTPVREDSVEAPEGHTVMVKEQGTDTLFVLIGPGPITADMNITYRYDAGGA